MTTFHIGTQGFSSRDWVGTFYPPGARATDYLDYYSRVFDTVEMKTTFYAIPTPDRITQWTERTPPGFVFTAKMPQLITHEKRLVDAATELGYFLESMRCLGPKLGAIVIQLPPSFRRDSEAQLLAFLELLPDDIRFATEFRHASWQDPAVLEALGAKGIAWCMNDWRDLSSIRQATTDVAYLRLNGFHERFTSLSHIQQQRSEDLKSWADTLLAMGDQVRHAYVYVNNHYAGHAPATINELRELVGLGAVDPRTTWDRSSSSPEQPLLFT